MAGCYLSELSWVEARARLRGDSVVVLPLGAAAKEHGPHLQLDNDRVLAEYFSRRLVEADDVIVAPTIAYHYYPAFIAYAGSTTLRLETARDLVVDIARSLAAFGPRRFYVLNTGVSTVRALEPAAELLAAHGILLHYTRIERAASTVIAAIQQQEGGSHADEVETSMMLYIAPQSVDMSKAARDFHPGSGPLTPDRDGAGVYSATGIYGDATLATREKGEAIVEAAVSDLMADIARLRATRLPAADSTTTC